MTHKDDPNEIGTPDQPGGPGRTEYEPLDEPKPGDIYVPDGGKPDTGPTSPSEH
jgi:hypothetical protein